MQILISIIEGLLVTLPALFIVAFTTLAERKTMASMQRRVGPNLVGFYGALQAFADALKLLLKEYVAPTQANRVLFYLGPIITLIFSLLGYAVIPYAAGLVLGDLNLGILYSLAVSSLSAYGILLAGWSANSKYAFLGSLRSTAQLISYELILSSAILIVVLLTSSLNLTDNVESQKTIYFIIPLLPIFTMFFIGAIAETNRAPFDLAEAESELVSGFMTEHSSVIFVFFFLAEYASIVLICIFTVILFLGGYLFIAYADFLINAVIGGISTGFKACFMIFVFIWVRASFPRIRYDQLMSCCWTILLPIVIALILFIPVIMSNLCLYSDVDFMPLVQLSVEPLTVSNSDGPCLGKSHVWSGSAKIVINSAIEVFRHFSLVESDGDCNLYVKDYLCESEIPQLVGHGFRNTSPPEFVHAEAVGTCREIVGLMNEQLVDLQVDESIEYAEREFDHNYDRHCTSRHFPQDQNPWDTMTHSDISESDLIEREPFANHPNQIGDGSERYTPNDTDQEIIYPDRGRNPNDPNNDDWFVVPNLPIEGDYYNFTEFDSFVSQHNAEEINNLMHIMNDLFNPSHSYSGDLPSVNSAIADSPDSSDSIILADGARHNVDPAYLTDGIDSTNGDLSDIDDVYDYPINSSNNNLLESSSNLVESNHSNLSDSNDNTIESNENNISDSNVSNSVSSTDEFEDGYHFDLLFGGEEQI